MENHSMAVKYGRGKFETHPNYIKYMHSIVDSEQFSGMPNAVSNGKINWQVSSGKTTSFYKFYQQRMEWWEEKADSLNLPGKGGENERFTIAARIINPTGYRACMLCGDDWNVGYFYLNANLYKRFCKLCPEGEFFKWQPIDSAIHELKKFMNNGVLEKLFLELFPEREQFFKDYGISKEAFEQSNYINTKAWLTPGYMGNPDSRLDGFHDYHFECRKNKDPGRFDANMKSYNHDRRSFEYWAQGNWMLADALYNSAEYGTCLDCPEGSEEIKVSPDHIGPISCGFKQLAFFKPLCATHNSAKNRRFTKYDVDLLIGYEKEEGESVASFQIQKHWDINKSRVINDDDTKQLSNSLRSLQDAYFRILHLLWDNGHQRFICTLLSPKHAFDVVKFAGLDGSNLTFDDFSISKKITPNRKSLYVRSIRIALSSLQEYVSKEPSSRKLMRDDFESNSNLIQELLASFSEFEPSELDKVWTSNISTKKVDENLDSIIAELTECEDVPVEENDSKKFKILKSCVDAIGVNATLAI